MKKLLILAAMAAALTAGSITVSAAPARNGPGFCRAAFTACEAAAEDALLCANRCGRAQNGGSAECPNDLCPNDGVPALDGTGYRGGRNGADGNSANTACPNGGTPARDGTGYRGGRNGADTDSANTTCPNGGTPARDGTGYRGGRNR